MEIIPRRGGAPPRRNLSELERAYQGWELYHKLQIIIRNSIRNRDQGMAKYSHELSNSIRGGLFSYLPVSTAMRHPEALARYWDGLPSDTRTYTSISGRETRFPFAGGPQWAPTSPPSYRSVSYDPHRQPPSYTAGARYYDRQPPRVDNTAPPPYTAAVPPT